jgi:probable rRNA maturation factor
MTSDRRDHGVTGTIVADVITEHGAWSAFGDDPAAMVTAAVAAVGRWPGLVTVPSEVAVALSSDAAVAALNAVYRGQAKPTNVLSFPAAASAQPPADLDDDDLPADAVRQTLGDVVLAEETLLREADEAGIPPAHHLQHLVVHGVLHLLGHDHDDDAAATRMEALETAILASLGVPDPYQEPVP